MHRKYTRFLLFSAVFLQKVTSKLSNDVLLTIHSDQDIDLLHLAALYNLTHIHSLDNKNHHFQLDNSLRRLRRSATGDHFLFKNEIYSLEVLPTKSRNFRNRNNDLLFSRPKPRFRRQTDSSPFGEPPSVIGLDYIAANLPNDPEWQNQWYLNRLKYKNYEHHLNVSAAWAMGFTGKGAKVTILDDGIEKDHPDLAKNYDKDSSYDYNSNDDDPMPRYNPSNENRHGTRCAGEVAAVKDNDFCIAGVAPDAFIGGIRMLDGDITDLVECKSVSHNIQHIDVYSSSWGPDDDGKTVDGPGKLTKKAFIDGVRDGRGGKGSIYVWASGNGGRYHDSCSCDGYCNSIYTITISSTTEFEKIPWYSEKCSSTLASTYSSGTRPEHSIVSTDLRHGCTQTHTGTSASAPIAAGLIALALEANPNLTWRDVQHIIVKSSNPKILHETGSFHTNSAGLEFSHNYGFGLMDAGRMCELAKNWKTVPEMKMVNINVHSESQSFGKEGIDAVYEIPTSVDGADLENFRIETVVIRITLDFTYRGYLEFFIESPTGTESQLLFKRQSDRSNHGFVAWEFMSVFHWDEPAAGKWKFRVVNQEPSTSSNKGHLKKLDFQFTGTLEIDWNNEVTTVTRNTLRDDAENEEPVVETTTENTTGSTTTTKTTTPTTSTSTVNLPPNCVSGTADRCDSCDELTILFENSCISKCPDGFGQNDKKCVRCDDSCETCHGEGRTDCTKCRDGLIFKNFKCEEPPSYKEPEEEDDEQLINGDPLTEAEGRKLHDKLTKELNSEEKDSIQYMVYQALVILTIVSIVAIVLYKYNLPPVSWFVKTNHYTPVQTDEF